MLKFIRIRFLQFIMVLSCIALGIAFAAQYAFGKAPCELCLIQRLPYFGVIIFGFFALFIGEWYRRGVAYLFCLIFVLGSFVAFYHVGVESHWWNAVTTCADAKLLPINLEELRNTLSNPIPKACDKRDWMFFGISAATYNTIISAFLAYFCLLGAAKCKRSL